MKTFILFVAVAVTGWVFALAPAAHAATITIKPTNASADVGTLDSATETFTQNVSGFNGTDASFDLVVTAVAEKGVWIEKVGDLGITSTGDTDENWDQAGENGDFTVTIASFVAGTSGYTVASVDFGMRLLTLDAAAGDSDSGTFDLINGVETAFTWVDNNAGSDFTGMLEPGDFDLQGMNGGVRVTSFSLNHAGGSGSAWRPNTLDIEYVFVPEPATMSLLAMGGLGVLLRRRRRRSA